jgi:hypothetical protein
MHHARAFLICTVAAIAACGDGPAPPPVQPPATSGTPAEVYSTLHSGVTAEVRGVARSAREWQLQWNVLRAAGADIGELAPPVEFPNRIVVFAAIGRREQAGFTVSLSAYTLQRDTLRITVLKVAPPPSCPTSSILTTPFAAAAVPRAAVVLFDELQHSTCGVF